jgi:hypothetical protein
MSQNPGAPGSFEFRHCDDVIPIPRATILRNESILWRQHWAGGMTCRVGGVKVKN